MEIEITKLYHDAELPEYAGKGDSGFDLAIHRFDRIYATSNDPTSTIEVMARSMIALPPRARTLVWCGFSVAIPEGYEMQIRSRSGYALKQGLVVLNSPGTIDSSYRGEIGALLINTSFDQIILRLKEKIAQGVIVPVIRAQWKEVDFLAGTARGANGFGSTDDKIKTKTPSHY